MWDRLARATIDGMLPPLEWETYQIHIPWRSNGVPPAPGACSTGLPAPPGAAAAPAGARATEAVATRIPSDASSRRRHCVTGRELTSALNTGVIEVLRRSRPS